MSDPHEEARDPAPRCLTASELGKALVAQRKPKLRACLVCGATFVTTSRRLYCCNRCRWRAHYRAHRDDVISTSPDSPPSGR